MSWDIYLKEKETESIGILSFSIEEGGTYVLGGTTDAELNVTYNYGKHFRFKETLDKNPAYKTIPILEETITTLGIERDADYWNPTPGNVGYACSILLKMAKELPDHIWSVC